MEGATGLDTEFIIAGEPFPAIIFGYVPAPGTPSAVGSRGVHRAQRHRARLPASSMPSRSTCRRPAVYRALPGLDLGRHAGRQDRQADRIPLGHADRSRQRRHHRLGRAGRCRRQVHDQQRSRWHLHADLVGRAAEPDPRSGQRDRCQRRDGRHGHPAARRAGGRCSTATSTTTPTATASRTRASRVSPGIRSDDAHARELADGSWYHLDHHRRRRLLQVRVRLSDDPVAGHGGLRRPALHDGRHLSGRQSDYHHHDYWRWRRCQRAPIIGLSGRMDWGKHTYDPLGRNGVDPRNGGIVGTVSYDTTRNELDPRYAAAEDWQPSISDLVVKLYAPGALWYQAAPCDTSGRYQLAADGSIAQGQAAQYLPHRNLGAAAQTASPAISMATRSRMAPTSRCCRRPTTSASRRR